MKHGFGVVLALILTLLIFQMGAPDEAWAQAIAIAISGSILVMVFHASQVHRLMRRGAEVAAVVATLIGIGTLIGLGDEAPEAFRLINVMVVAVAPPVIAWGVIANLRENQGVTLRAVAGVLCVYLLLGMIFASLYSAISEIGHGAFFAGDDPSTISDFLYFSYTTLTTTGYGDLVPVGNFGRSLAILEQLIGAIYLVTVVAVLVGNLRPRQRPA